MAGSKVAISMVRVFGEMTEAYIVNWRSRMGVSLGPWHEALDRGVEVEILGIRR